MTPLFYVLVWANFMGAPSTDVVFSLESVCDGKKKYHSELVVYKISYQFKTDLFMEKIDVDCPSPSEKSPQEAQ